MRPPLTEGALFAGIMGFGEGFRRAGFKNLWAVEKEPFCRAVIRTKFPETELFEDVRECGKHNLRAVDVLTAGFPCQDLSVAGKRAGLGGHRSGLFWEIVRVLREFIDDGRPIPWFVLENVPGLFSSFSDDAENGEPHMGLWGEWDALPQTDDFETVLTALDELGYGLAWRVLDSQFFGVAQRRRRVFIVGCFGKPCPQEVLFEPESGEGDFATGGETWEGVAAPLTSGIGISGNAPGRRREDDINLAIAGPLNTRNGHSINAEDAAGSHIVATALSRSNGHHGHSSPRGDGSDNLVFHDAKWAKGSSGPAGDEHHNLIAAFAVTDYANYQERLATLRAEGGDCGLGSEVLVSNSEHQERSRQQLDPAREVDGAMRRDDYECSSADPHGVRDFTGLPEGLESARYRALGNAVTVKVSRWIARRIKQVIEQSES